MKADQKQEHKPRTRRTLKVQDIETKGNEVKGGSTDRSADHGSMRSNQAICETPGQ